MKVNAKLTFT